MACLQKILRINKSILGCTKQLTRCYSTELTKSYRTLQPIPTLSLVQEINDRNPWIYQQNDKIDSPLLNIIRNDIMEVPVVKLPLLDPVLNNIEIKTPGTEESKQEKQAVRLIVIRRHKMRKHKLKKLRKKMKFEWAKRRQRREWKKEKEFQAGLISQIKEAEMFSAEQYVAEKIQKATEVPIPRYWKGKRLPEFIIRQKLGLPPK